MDILRDHALLHLVRLRRWALRLGKLLLVEGLDMRSVCLVRNLNVRMAKGTLLACIATLF